MSKDEVLKRMQDQLDWLGFAVVEKDTEKPWGAYFRISDEQIEEFIDYFFEHLEVDRTQNLSPKILIVAPEKKLSWQEHARRNEIWRVIEGPVGVYLSETDEQPEEHQVFDEGEFITIGDRIRHRLVGLDNWGIVAEIWVHTDHQNPSNEDDIRRIADDFGR